jgi:hypothetical protein
MASPVARIAAQYLIGLRRQERRMGYKKGTLQRSQAYLPYVDSSIDSLISQAEALVGGVNPLEAMTNPRGASDRIAGTLGASWKAKADAISRQLGG